MNKLNFAVYPAIAALSLGAAFAAHAQSALDPVDGAAYGATYQVMPAAAKSVAAKTQVVVVQGNKDRVTPYADAADQAGYGATQVATSTLTRAEVRAALMADRANTDRIVNTETGEVLIVRTAATADNSRVLAGSIDKNVK